MQRWLGNRDMDERDLLVDNSVRLALKAVGDLPFEAALHVLHLASELLAQQESNRLDPIQLELGSTEYGNQVISVAKELLQIEAGDCRAAYSIAEAAIAVKLKEYEPLGKKQ